MADDTRQREDLSKEALTVHPEHKPFTGAQWEGAKSKTYTQPENANMLAGGTENTAGGKLPEVSISNAFDGRLKTSDFTELPKKPCVRDSFLTGIGGGFAIGGIRATIGGKCHRLRHLWEHLPILTINSGFCQCRQLGCWHLLLRLIRCVPILSLQAAGRERWDDACCRDIKQEPNREESSGGPEGEGKGREAKAQGART